MENGYSIQEILLAFADLENKEFLKKDILESKSLTLTNKKNDLKLANCFIITVPTPVNQKKKPKTSPKNSVLTNMRL